MQITNQAGSLKNKKNIHINKHLMSALNIYMYIYITKYRKEKNKKKFSGSIFIINLNNVNKILFCKRN